MINNRQNGRRRGRGGGGGGGGGNGQRQGGQGRGDSGNRIDSRARGNAAQLLEKYKNLASDAQRQGDRVNTEYYLQFADHYFRVLADQRGRFENQQQRPQSPAEFDLDGDDDYGDEGDPIRAGDQQGEGDAPAQQGGQRRDRDRDENRGNRWDGNREARQERGDRPRREARDDRQDRTDRQDRQEVAGQHRSDPPVQDESLNARADAVLEADAPVAPRRRGRPRREAATAETQGEANGVDADRLPPSLGIATPANDSGDDEPKPRRRRTRAAVEVPTAAE